jgi:hypothetical protein
MIVGRVANHILKFLKFQAGLEAITYLNESMTLDRAMRQRLRSTFQAEDFGSTKANLP